MKHIHAVNDLAEHRIAVHFRLKTAVVEILVVLGVDVELSRGAVDLTGAAHGDAAGFVLQLVGCFINDRLAGRFLLHVRGQATTHRALGAARELRTPVVACAVARVLLEAPPSVAFSLRAGMGEFVDDLAGVASPS